MQGNQVTSGRSGLSPCVGLAVSGGGDSMAMLNLAVAVAAQTGQRLCVATVDHGLRPDSATEAVDVARHAARLGLPHDTLHWHDRPSGGNLQAAARDARYGLLAQWAQARGAELVLLGHTADDQAETLLMRLAREAGLDGLRGMQAQFTRHGVAWARPLLGMTRAELRLILQDAGLSWAEDPSNSDLRFARIMARQALATLAPLGIEAAGLARVAAQLSEARDALHLATVDLARQAIRQEAGDLILDWDQMAAAPSELRRRCLVAGLGWITGAPYPPRRDDVAQALAALAEEGQRTLSGCLLRRSGAWLRLMREPHALRDKVTGTCALWDGRWRLEGPHDQGLHVAALGEAGLMLCPDWRDSGLPRMTLLASPAIWAGARLVAAPLTLPQGAPAGPWRARIVADFHDWVVSH